VGDVRILCLNPTSSRATTAALVEASGAWSRRHRCLIETERIAGAPERLESMAEVSAVESMVQARAMRLGRDGYDAMIVASTMDPGLPDGWALAPEPVIGIGWAAMRRACAIDWGMLCPHHQDPGMARAQAEHYGLDDRLVAVQSAGRADYQPQSAAMLASEVNRLAAAGARSVVLGSASMARPAAAIWELVKVEVVEPLEAALDVASAAIQQSFPLTHDAIPGSRQPPRPSSGR